MSIQSFLSKWVPVLTPQWLPAFNAHWCFAGFVTFATMFLAPHLLWPCVALQVVIAGVKEFYIDKHFETTKQTFLMNLSDFGGYMFGIVLSLLIAGKL